MLEQFVSRSLQDLTGQMFSGAVAPNPIVRGPKASSCSYCDYERACHKDACPIAARYMKKVSAEEFWDTLERRKADG